MPGAKYKVMAVGPQIAATATAPVFVSIAGVAKKVLPNQPFIVANELVCCNVGAPEAQEGPAMTVLIYVNTSKQVGDPEHLKVFAHAHAAETWLQENDPEGMAFEYEVLE